MQPRSQDPRIESMYRGDLAWALVALLVLWLTILFVFYKVMVSSASSGVVTALAIFGGLVLLFNTASILALLKHYAEDKVHLYGLDIHYLDEMRAKR
jgi:hypothetical protein